MAPHECETTPPVYGALYTVALSEPFRSLDLVQKDALHRLDVDDIQALRAFDELALVGDLAAALRVEGRPVEDDVSIVDDGDDLSLEVRQVGVLVEEGPRLLKPLNPPRQLGSGGFLSPCLARHVSIGDEGVEVLRDGDGDACLGSHFLDVFGGEAVGVVELDELVDGDAALRSPEVPLHEARAAPDGPSVLLALDGDHLHDLVPHLTQLGEVAAPEVDLSLDEVGQPILYAAPPQQPEAPPEQQPGQVALADVGGDDALR